MGSRNLSFNFFDISVHVLMSSIDPVLAITSKSGVGIDRNNSEFDEDDDLREYLRTARQEHRRNTDFSQVQSNPSKI